MKTWMLAAVLAGGASLSFVAQAQTSQPVMTEVTTVETYKASSEGALGVAQWLRAQEAYVDGELGDIVVTRSRSHSGLYQAQSPGDDPPVGLPAFGSPGEEISIGSVRGAVTQSWTYRWVGTSVRGNWVLIDYKYSNTLPK
ncbi:hypothetical protein LU699_13235 [Luteimonas fraxinea]|uniref:SH3 domain-containing protein n=1 Tax=Luteimonas fraxinea TaxID=2901869 RepID=A0ABS8UEU6_9GAMM|nr:hypothetical protein [Luteimonas fraxinea]MCD9098022.1 hypothetical protein [Luteimonas fraxinea]UHH09251.1 hypothetical protein LU699_13235 [Luteimonas fraxinea]